MACLLEELDPGAVLPLQPLETNLVRRHLVTPDTPVCGPHQIDGDPTIDVSARPRVGFPPLFGEATGYPFKGSRCLHTQKPFNGGNEGREVLTLMEEILQLHLLLCPICLL